MAKYYCSYTIEWINGASRACNKEFSNLSGLNKHEKTNHGRKKKSQMQRTTQSNICHMNTIPTKSAFNSTSSTSLSTMTRHREVDITEECNVSFHKFIFIYLRDAQIKVGDDFVKSTFSNVCPQSPMSYAYPDNEDINLVHTY
jgi:hypothetical protein